MGQFKMFLVMVFGTLLYGLVSAVSNASNVQQLK